MYVSNRVRAQNASREKTVNLLIKLPGFRKVVLRQHKYDLFDVEVGHHRKDLVELLTKLS